MEKEHRCPICGILLYRRGEDYRCHLHGDFRLDWATGRLVKYDRCKHCEVTQLKASGYETIFKTNRTTGEVFEHNPCSVCEVTQAQKTGYQGA